jgi:DNA-binding CsgD family transcriptional regulator
VSANASDAQTVSAQELAYLAYQGIDEEAPWSSLLRALRVRLQADAAVFLLESPDPNRPSIMFSEGGYSASIEVYKHQLFGDDPFRNLPPGVATTVHEHVGRRALAQMPFFTHYMRAAGSHFLLGMDIVEKSGVRARLRASRGEHRSDFGDGDKAVFLALKPHLVRALEMFVRFVGAEAERDLYGAALDRSHVAVFHVASNGRIIDANSVGREMARSGIVVRSVGGVLRLTGTAAASRRLDEEITRNSRAAERRGSPPPVVAMRLSGSDHDYALTVRPAPHPSGFIAPVNAEAVVIISRLDHRPSITPDMLVQLFGLTRAEAGLAAKLAEGHDLDSAAHEMGISRNTARHHLRSVFPKTGVTRQSDLICLVLRSCLT